MDVGTLKSYIKTGNIPHFLIFAGDEWAVQKIYIDQIAKVTGLQTNRPDTVKEVVRSLRNRSFVNRSCIYIVRDDKEFMQSEKLQNRLEQAIGDNFLVLLLTKLDKRVKFYNKYKSNIVEFEALQPQILAKYIQKQIHLSDQNCQKLIEVCESSYGRILLEIDKILRYDDGMSANEEEAELYDLSFKSLLESGVIYKPPKDVIFDLVNAIMQRKKKSFELLQESYSSGEATMVMLTVLFNTAKAVLQVQTYRGSGKITESTGLTGFQVMKAKEVMGHYKEQELIDMLHLIREVETGIKTGRMEDKFAMQYLLTKVL